MSELSDLFPGEPVAGAVTPAPKKSGASNHRHSSNQKVGTPWNFIRAVEARFGPLNYDLAAFDSNKKAGKYITEVEDSFKFDWHKCPGNLWLNPPFGLITPWAEKCWLECQKGAKILFLTPASVDAAWWTNFVHKKACVLFLSPRIQFEGHDDPFPKPMALSVFNQDGIFPEKGHVSLEYYQPWRWRE